MLVSCESRFNENAKGDYRIEEDRFMARGILQFWPSTFRNYSKLYGTKGAYTDPFTQIDLALKIITEDKKGWRHWYNCGKAVGFAETKHLTLK